jgi:soluble lytic murein transglycosylase-like protein
LPLAGLAFAAVCAGAQAALYVYQVPGGTRIVTDRPIKNKDYVLVRKSDAAVTMDELVAQQRAETVWTDAGRYAGLIHKTATAHRVEPALIQAVMHAESAFDPYAVSARGAQGLMQLTPETARRYGVRDVFDPAQNIEGGVRFLRDLTRAFGPNSDLVPAAYNAGLGAVLRHNGVPPYDETQAYVRKVRLFRDYYSGRRASSAPTVAEQTFPADDFPVAPSGATAESVKQPVEAEPLLTQETEPVVAPAQLVSDARRRVEPPEVRSPE